MSGDAKMISVIIPARNEERFIAAALQSVIGQVPNGELEAIVVDDGSTDATAAIVGAFAAEGARVRLIRGQAKGVSAARNEGLAAISAQTSHVAFLDADDMFPKGRLARDLMLFAQDSSLAVIYGKLRLVETDVPDMEAAQSDADRILLGISVSAGLYRWDVLAKVGAFDPTYALCEDFDYLLRLFEQRPSTRVVDDVSVYYRQHAGNTVKRTAELRRSFMRAALAHAKRRKSNPDLHPVDWIWAQNELIT
jgi:glycosyltransferase involved in cell wall biosynthesis